MLNRGSTDDRNGDQIGCVETGLLGVPFKDLVNDTNANTGFEPHSVVNDTNAHCTLVNDTNTGQRV